jgi:hypothetical protein
MPSPLRGGQERTYQPRTGYWLVMSFPLGRAYAILT